MKKKHLIKDFEKTEPDSKSVELLSIYYKDSNRVVKEKYGIDIENWL